MSHPEEGSIMVASDLETETKEKSTRKKLPGSFRRTCFVAVEEGRSKQYLKFTTLFCALVKF
jgi:hypothetical protein